MSLLALVAAATLAASGQEAAASSPQEAPITLDEVVVEGARLEALTRQFVEEVGAPPRRRGLARWRDPICVGVVNIRHEIAQVIADRVSQVALEYGVAPREPGCRPNVLVVFAEDAAAMAREMVDRRRRIFDFGVGGFERGDLALEDFRGSDQPVRWWHVSVPVDANTGAIGIRVPGGDAPFVTGDGLVNRGRSLRDDLNKVIVVVDASRLGDVPLPQLADYIAMVSLAQVDPDGRTGRYDTILNLFSADGAATGLSDWDRAYLQALYRGPSERIRDSDQTRELLRNLRHARERQEGAFDAP